MFIEIFVIIFEFGLEGEYFWKKKFDVGVIYF